MSTPYGWYDTRYPYRRKLNFGTSHDYLPNGYTVEFEVDTRTAYTHVAKENGDDVLVVKQQRTSPYIKSTVTRVLKPGDSWNSTSTHVRFKLPCSISANQNDAANYLFYIYYGRTDPPSQQEYNMYAYLWADDAEGIAPTNITDVWDYTNASISYQTSYPKYGSKSIKFWDTSTSSQGKLSQKYSYTRNYRFRIDFWIRHGAATDHTFGYWNTNIDHWIAYIYFDDYDHHIKYWKESTSSYVDTGYSWSENTYEHYVLDIETSSPYTVKLIKNGTTIASNCNPDGYDTTYGKLYYYGNYAGSYLVYIDNVFIYYYVDNSPDVTLSTEEAWTGISLANTMFVKGYGTSDLSQRLGMATYGHNDLQNETAIRKSASKDLPSQLNMRLSEDSNLDNQLLLRASGSSDILNELSLRQETSKDLNNQLLLKMYGTNFLQKLLMRRELYSTLLNELQLGEEKLNLESILTTLERDTFTDDYNNETYIDTLSDLVVEDGKVRLKKWGE